KMLASAHDLSEGGLFVALTESCMHQNMGFEIKTDSSVPKEAFLFGEAQSRVIVTVKPEMQKDFEAALGGQKFSLLGKVKADGHLRMDGGDWGHIKEWKKAYDEAIEQALK